MKDKIKSSYSASRNFYDDVITHRKWWSKIYSRVVWNGVNDPKIADFVAKNVLSKKGWFTPPFDTEQSIKQRLKSNFAFDFFASDGAIIYFGAYKK